MLKVTNLFVILLYFFISVNAFSADADEVETNYKKDIDILKNDVARLSMQVRELALLLENSDIGKYNTVRLDDYSNWTLEEKIQKASLILLRKPSQDGKKVLTEVLKKGIGVAYKPEEEGDEIRYLEYMNEFNIDAYIFFYFRNPPIEKGAITVRGADVIADEYFSLQKFKKLARSYDGK